MKPIDILDSYSTANAIESSVIMENINDVIDALGAMKYHADKYTSPGICLSAHLLNTKKYGENFKPYVELRAFKTKIDVSKERCMNSQVVVKSHHMPCYKTMTPKSFSLIRLPG